MELKLEKWPIIGYGWKIDWKDVDPVKYAIMSGYNNADIEKAKKYKNALLFADDNGLIMDDFDNILKYPHKYNNIQFYNSCQAGFGQFILYPTKSYFLDELSNISNDISNIIGTIILDDIDITKIKKQIKFFNLYGEG